MRLTTASNVRATLSGQNQRIKNLPRPSRRVILTTSGLLGLGFLSGLFSGNKAQAMGGSSSSLKHWMPRGDGEPTGKIISKSGFDVTPMTEAERAAAAAQLNDLQKYVNLKAGTERAFTGVTVDGAPWDNKRKGVYVSAVSGVPLFTSETKYNSGTGWPSFFAPYDPEHVMEIVDDSIPFMRRVEVVDRKSGAHLGHVFGACIEQSDVHCK